jgi:limonene-1,2-epoxide hydrolase
MTPDATFDNVPIGRVVGHDAVKEAFEGFFGMAENVDFEVLNMAGSGTVVFAERVDHFDMGEIHVDLPCTGVFEMVDGRIAAWRDYFDVAMFNQQTPSLDQDELQKLAQAHGG